LMRFIIMRLLIGSLRILCMWMRNVVSVSGGGFVVVGVGGIGVF